MEKDLTRNIIACLAAFGVGYPTFISKQIEHERESVNNRLRELEEKGFLEKVKGRGERGKRSYYFFTREGIEEIRKGRGLQGLLLITMALVTREKAREKIKKQKMWKKPLKDEETIEIGKSLYKPYRKMMGDLGPAYRWFKGKMEGVKEDVREIVYANMVTLLIEDLGEKLGLSDSSLSKVREYLVKEVGKEIEFPAKKVEEKASLGDYGGVRRAIEEWISHLKEDRDVLKKMMRAVENQISFWRNFLHLRGEDLDKFDP